MVCDTVFASTGYSASMANLSRITLASDDVFSDGATLHIPTVSGSVGDGYTAALMVAVAGEPADSRGRARRAPRAPWRGNAHHRAGR